MLGRVAKLHYEHGLTHQQIADALGLSRVKVTRLLAEARRTGVVEIRVNSDERLFTDLEVALADRFGLRQAWVAPAAKDPSRLRASLGIVGAGALLAVLRPGMTVAVGLSATVAAIAPGLHRAPAVDVLLVPATGSRLGAIDEPSAQDVAQSLARALRGRAHHLPAPVLAASPASAALLRQEPDVASALDRARNADLAIVGVGGTTPGSGLLMQGAVPDAVLAELRDAGAVGGILASYYDADGTPVPTALADRIIGITLDELASIELRIGVAGGPDKLTPLRGALAGHHLDVLVTDDRTASQLLRG